mgnify:CR=1 FL=1
MTECSIHGGYYEIIYYYSAFFIRLGMTLLLIAIAFALRAWPLGSTGTRFPWLTFYPAVMVAAVYGGIFQASSEHFFHVRYLLLLGGWYHKNHSLHQLLIILGCISLYLLVLLFPLLQSQ